MTTWKRLKMKCPCQHDDLNRNIEDEEVISWNRNGCAVEINEDGYVRCKAWDDNKRFKI